MVRGVSRISIFFPGEAARTRSVAKRSLKESGMVASRVATKTVGEWEWVMVVESMRLCGWSQ